MLDLTPLANAVKTVASPPPQAQPAIAEETKAVPDTETTQAVPAPPAGKGGNGPGVGEHLDLYDTENRSKPPPKTTRQKVDEAREEARRRKLLTHDAAMPQPSDPPPPDIPFLRPLGHPPLGASIDATI